MYEQVLTAVELHKVGRCTALESYQCKGTLWVFFLPYQECCEAYFALVGPTFQYVEGTALAMSQFSASVQLVSPSIVSSVC